MSQLPKPSRKPQHQQQSPPAVKEEQQEQEEEGTHSIGAGNNGNHCSSSSNFENSNNTIGSAGGNGGDDINQLKLKMAALEANHQILEGRLAYQELNARILAMDKKMMDEFGQSLTPLETKHQQEIDGLKCDTKFLLTDFRLFIGFSFATIKKNTWIGRIPNTYAMQDEKPDYCFLSGEIHYFDWPDGVIKPILRGSGDVFGCGFVLSADNKLAIFFTVNGILMGKQIPIVHDGSILYPTVQLNRNITVEANFGQKQFKYNINECPGLQLQW